LYLPTLTSGTWTTTALLQSLDHELRRDRVATRLAIFAYAVTSPGWRELCPACILWLRRGAGRKIVAYVGTDHGLSDPEALREMARSGVEVRIMRRYQGIFHAKVFWLRGPDRNRLWVGSNNLTREGLLNNIEFALMVESPDENPDLIRWQETIHSGSEPMSDELINSYEAERQEFARGRASSPGTFTWSRKEEPAEPRERPTKRRPRMGRRELIVEIMPLETGSGGAQIQLPKQAAIQFFDLADSEGASRHISLTPVGTNDTRKLKMTLFGNNTIRLNISDLDYRDRPCLLVFQSNEGENFSFEIVKESLFPTRYRRLLAQCSNQTRIGSRRWTII
jgi:hypothetical protein